TVDADAERAAYRRALLEARLRALQADGVVPGGPAASAPPALAPEARERLIERLYESTELPDKPRNALGLAKRIPVEEMEVLLLAHLPADDAALRALARQRGEAVRDAVVGNGVPAEQ